jgi:hypothetical protein
MSDSKAGAAMRSGGSVTDSSATGSSTSVSVIPRPSASAAAEARTCDGVGC